MLKFQNLKTVNNNLFQFKVKKKTIKAYIKTIKL